jgi:hypothetical protein
MASREFHSQPMARTDAAEAAIGEVENQNDGPAGVANGGQKNEQEGR